MVPATATGHTGVTRCSMTTDRIGGTRFDTTIDRITGGTVSDPLVGSEIGTASVTTAFAAVSGSGADLNIDITGVAAACGCAIATDRSS
jgi:hypothetical protein